MDWSGDDDKMLQALIEILDEKASFSLKWREAAAFAIVRKWLYDLKSREKSKPKAAPKKSKSPVKNGNSSRK